MATLSPAVSRHVESLVKSLERRQLVGSHAIASAVVKLLREVVAAARFPTFEALITYLQEIGLKLEQAAPHDFVVGNIVRRVIKFLREEYTTAFETATPSAPPTPTTFGAAPTGTADSPAPSTATDFFTSAPAFRRQSTHNLSTSASSSSLSRHTSVPAYQPSITTMLDLLGHHGSMPLHLSAGATVAPDSPGSPGRLGSPMSPASFSPAISRAPSYAHIRRSMTSPGADDTDFSRRSHELKPIFVDAIAELRDELDMIYETVGAQAPEHVHSGEIIMTLGYSRTVEAFLRAAARKRKFTVVVVETAPSFSGRILAKALSTADPPVDTVLIPDAAVFALMSRCTKVLLGAHTVLADGGLLAIAGSLPVARAAKAHLVPVVCCAGMFKFAPRFLGEAAYGALDWGSPAEVLRPEETPAIADVLNPYYDRVPSELISLFVTNIGGHPPSMCSRLLADMYGS